MGVLSREFLKKLYLKDNEIAIVDMEAGIEHFGRGVETSIDSVLLVVDPSFESLQLADKVNSMTREIGIERTLAVLNKIPSDDIAFKLEEKLRNIGIDTIGCIPYDAEIFEAGLEGSPVQSSTAQQEIGKIIDTLLSDVKTFK